MPATAAARAAWRAWTSARSAWTGSVGAPSERKRMERSRSSREARRSPALAGIRHQLGVGHLNGVAEVGAAKILEEAAADLPERLGQAATGTSQRRRDPRAVREDHDSNAKDAQIQSLDQGFRGGDLRHQDAVVQVDLLESFHQRPPHAGLLGQPGEELGVGATHRIHRRRDPPRTREWCCPRDPERSPGRDRGSAGRPPAPSPRSAAGTCWIAGPLARSPRATAAVLPRRPVGERSTGEPDHQQDPKQPAHSRLRSLSLGRTLPTRSEEPRLQAVAIAQPRTEICSDRER